MAIDAKDVGELQKALNDASGKASALWIAFVTFELYLAIAFGAVTHRDLFLENPIKLPVLNVDLPLVGFFVVAPTVLLIFHFYVFLQLLALVRKAADFNALLKQQALDEVDSQFLRHRLDSFLMLQFLAGPAEQRAGYTGVWLRVIAWITLVGAPIVIFLQAQVTFLPYHLSWVQWLLRICILIDLAVIWCFWDPVRSEDQPISKWIPTIAWWTVGGVATAVVVAFSIFFATFPGESGNEHFSALPFRETLFAGDADEITGRPRGLFSDRLVLTDQSFVDADKIEKLEVSHSFRGRDLRQAVLNRADLRKADFTGAILNAARVQGAKLQGARLVSTRLQGAELQMAELQGAALFMARLEGAKLMGAKLQGADLRSVRLQGANLMWAELQGVELQSAELQGANIEQAQLQGALLSEAQLQGASLNKGFLWLVRGTPKIGLTDLGNFDMDTAPWKDADSTFDQWQNTVLKWLTADEKDLFLKQFKPEWKSEELIPADFWKDALSTPPQGEQRKAKLAEFLANLACYSGSSPYVARGLLRNGRMEATGTQIVTVAEKLRKGKSDETACPGVKGFTDQDWGWLDKLVALAKETN
jgi:uncharacterized protein YjbI with pentapeptide repeats